VVNCVQTPLQQPANAAAPPVKQQEVPQQTCRDEQHVPSQGGRSSAQRHTPFRQLVPDGQQTPPQGAL
jgi:hypothetical protein